VKTALFLSVLKKIGIFVLFVLSACVIAALYGIVHDQLTFTISNEYYTKFKFVQFGLVDEFDAGTDKVSPRLLVTLTGIIATWWTGLIAGPIIGLFVLLLPGKEAFFNQGLRGLIVALAVSAGVGLLGLLVGYVYFSPQVLAGNIHWNLGADIIAKTDYIAVGSMHNFSYLGGIIGIISALVRLRKDKQSTSNLNEITS